MTDEKELTYGSKIFVRRRPPTALVNIGGLDTLNSKFTETLLSWMSTFAMHKM